MPVKLDLDPKIEDAMGREAPLHAKYKEVEPDLTKELCPGTRGAMHPGLKGMPPAVPHRGDALGSENDGTVSAT